MLTHSPHATARHRNGSHPPAFWAFGPGASAKALLIPLLAFSFTAIISPLSDHLYGDTADLFHNAAGGRLANKLFWPLLALIALIIAFRNMRRLRVALAASPALVLCLFLAYAGLSVTWAFRPDISFTRYVQQVLLILALVLPAVLVPPSHDLMRGIFVCCGIGAIINLGFVFAGFQTTANNIYIGYSGYYTHKNVLGIFAAMALFFCLHEIAYPRLRRLVGLLMSAICIYLLVVSGSKTSMSLVLFVPCLAAALLAIAHILGQSPTTIIVSLLGLAVVGSAAFSITIYDISQVLFGDRTFTRRTEIWDFVNWEISRHPWLGWGFQSFWLVGPGGPSLTDAQGWIRNMPQAHNGFLDIELTTGRIGLALMLIYVGATFHAIARLAAVDIRRAWLLYTIALFTVISNVLETTLLEGHGFQWPLFVLCSVEAGRVLERRIGRGASSQAPNRAPLHRPSHRITRPAI